MSASANSTPHSVPLLLVTTDRDRDPTIPTLVRGATSIPVREHAYAYHDLESADATLFGELADVQVVAVDLGTLQQAGIELCARLHQWRARYRPRLKLLALGAERSEEHEDAAFLAGCDAFVARPLDRVAFLENLRRLGTWKLRGAHRAPVRAPVTWTRLDGSTCAGQVVDLSDLGVLFRSEPVPMGENIALEIALPDRPPVHVWVRALRVSMLEQEPSGHAAEIAAEFLNLSDDGHRAIREAIAAVRRDELLARLATEYSEKPIVLTDPQTGLIADNLYFLFTPVAFGDPPAPCGVDEAALKEWALRLPPSEDKVFHEIEVAGDPSPGRWVRAWVGFRIRLAEAALRAMAAETTAEVEAFLDEARELLAILSESLSAWNLFEKGMPGADLYCERASVFLTLREGLALRELYEDHKRPGAPAFLAAIERPADFFADRDYDVEQTTYERGAFRTRAQRERGGRKRRLRMPASVRPGLLVLAALVVLAGGALLVHGFWSVQHRVAPDRGMLMAFPELARAGFSTGDGPRVFFGEVDREQWSAMSAPERDEIARRLKSYLEIGDVGTALISNGRFTAIQIENGRILIVR